MTFTGLSVRGFRPARRGEAVGGEITSGIGELNTTKIGNQIKNDARRFMTYEIGVARPKTKENPVKITLYLDERYRDLLQELAGNDKRSPSQYVENLIIEAAKKEAHILANADELPASGIPILTEALNLLKAHHQAAKKVKVSAEQSGKKDLAKAAQVKKSAKDSGKK